MAAKRMKKFSQLTPAKLILALAVLLVLPVTLIVQNQHNIKQEAKADTFQPVGQTGNWSLIFDDEFNTTALDATKWITCYGWANPATGCTNTGNHELEWYLPANVSVANGLLTLEGKRQRVTGSDGVKYNYTSGMIASAGKFSQTYYYMEMRAKLPKGQGVWPAFWTLPSDNSWPPEIDAMEMLGNDPTNIHMTYHWGPLQNPQQDGSSFIGSDFSTGFHTYAVDWEPNAITWYIDGVQRKQYTDTANIVNAPMYILANLALGGDWPGSPNSTTPFPSDMQIDYIRVWQPSTTTPTPSTGSGLTATPMPTITTTPTPTATPVPTNTPTPLPVNLLQNSSFETTGSNWITPWVFKTVTGAKGSITHDSSTKADGTYSVNISITQSNANYWDAQLLQGLIPMTSGRTYTITFWAKASKNRAVNAIWQQDYSPYTTYFQQAFNLTTSWQQYSTTFTPTQSDSDTLFDLNFAQATGNVWFDKVSIQ